MFSIWGNEVQSAIPVGLSLAELHKVKHGVKSTFATCDSLVNVLPNVPHYGPNLTSAIRDALAT